MIACIIWVYCQCDIPTLTARDAKDCVSDFLPSPVITSARRSSDEVLIYPKVSAAKIIRVERIQNSKLWSTFCQEDDFIREKLGKDSNIRRLFHGTGTTSPDLIYSKSEEGFDHRYSKEGLWGRAIYFAERSAYSHNYSHKNSEGYN